MRWHVYGTDAESGRHAELILEEIDATNAIKSAIDRQIVVGRITSERSRLLKRMLRPVNVAFFLAALGTSGGLYWENAAVHLQMADKTEQADALRHNLQQALAEQARLAGSVTQAQQMLMDIQSQGTLAELDAAKVKLLGAELASARNRMSLTDQQLTAAHHQMDDLERRAGRVPVLEIKLATTSAELAGVQEQMKAGETQVKGLQQEVAMQAKHIEQLVGATETHRVAELEKANLALVAENEKYRSEMLVMAARADGEASTEPSTAPATSMRWALRAPYDAARSFLLLHIDRDSLVTASGPDGTFITSGRQIANITKLRFVHDRAKERVYDATLTVSLAADGPRDKIAENTKLVGEFVRALAPGFKEPDMLVTQATEQLKSEDSNRRLIYLGDDCKVTAWNDGHGLFTFRIDSARDLVE